MSGRRSISLVDFSSLSFRFDRVRRVSVRSFLVRNWCGDSRVETNGVLCSAAYVCSLREDLEPHNLKVIGSNSISATKYQALENMMFSRAFCCRYFGSKFRWWKRQKESRSAVGQGVDVSSSEGQESGGSGLQRTAISVAGSAADTEDDDEDAARPLPDRLITELTAHRTLALRDALAENPASPSRPRCTTSC
jgi:hypothetical protein